LRLPPRFFPRLEELSATNFIPFQFIQVIMWKAALKISKPLVVALPVALGVHSQSHNGLDTFSDSSFARCDSAAPTENLGMYLNEQSKERLKKHLAGRGVKGNEVTPYVCFARRDASHQDSKTEQDFHLLYGAKSAFRLKGIIHTEKGYAVGVGRLSTYFVNDIKDDDFEVSVPFLPADSSKVTQEDINELLDLPTRIKAIPGMENKVGRVWKGRVPAGSVHSRHYGAANKTVFAPIPFADQIVLQGTICSDKYAQAGGVCGFDRDEYLQTLRTAEEKAAELEPAAAAVAESAAPATAAEVPETASASETSPAAEAPVTPKECPVCTFLKGGPCKDKFIVWDACVQNVDTANGVDFAKECFQPTLEMAHCFNQHEYYDIMNDGRDYEKELNEARKHDEAAAAAAATAETTGTQQTKEQQ
jgi:hypothetical protein